MAGGIDGARKESNQRAFAYLQARKVEMGLGQLIESTDFHVEAIDLLSNRHGCEAGVAFFVAVQGATFKPPP